MPGATVLFDGTPRPTTYVSSMQVSFDLTNADLSVGGPHQISVLNPGPGGGESGSNNFFVEYNQVGISGLTPSFAPVGSAGFTLNINGGIFDTGSVVRWDGIDRATKFIDRNNLTITLSAADLAVTGSHSVIVFDPRNGALISDSATFAVVANTPPTGQVESFGNGFNGSHTIGTSAILSVRGWVGDYGDNTSMVAFLRVNGSDQNLASTSVDLPRPDIALQYNRPDWVNSGFQFATNLGNRPGTYTIQIIGKDRFGATSGLPIQGGSNVVTIVDEPKPTGLLDSVAGPDGSFTVPQDSNVYVSGWAAIQGSWESPAGVRIFLNDILHPVGDAQIGIARPDLVTLTGNPGLLNRGFAFQFNIGSAPLGLHYIIPEAFNPVGDSALLGFSDGTGAVLVNVVSPDTTIAKPNIVPLVSSLSFETEQVGSVSTAQSVTITNAGGGPLNVLGVSISGDFSQTNNCRVIVAGSSCSMSVTFHPSEVGNRTGEVTIYSNASTSPSSIVLSGAGAGVGVLSISSVSVSFGPQLIGTSSPTQSVTLSNTGNAVLIIHGISVSSAFSQQNTCGTPLAAGSNCTVSIGFNPNSGGAIAGTLQIGTNAAPSVVTVPISGIGQDFMLTPGPSSTTSATVVAGQTATYLLTLSPIGGMSGTVNFGCSGTPPHASCSISPTAASLGTVTNITVAVTTGGGQCWCSN